HDNRGYDLFGQSPRDVDGAIAEFRVAIRINKDFAPARFHLGVALSHKGDVEGAIAELREATRINKDYAEGHYALGVTLRDTGDVAGAIAEFRETIRINERNPFALNNLAWLLANAADEKLRDPQEAVMLATRAIAMGSGLNVRWTTLGVAHYRNGEWESAV